MRFQKTVLALAATLAVAAPAAAFAQDWRSQDNGYRQEQSREHRYDQRGEYRYHQRRVYRGYSDHRGYRPQVCRMGVFYMRGSWCATHRHDAYRYDHRDHRGDDRRW